MHVDIRDKTYQQITQACSSSSEAIYDNESKYALNDNVDSHPINIIKGWFTIRVNNSRRVFLSVSVCKTPLLSWLFCIVGDFKMAAIAQITR